MPVASHSRPTLERGGRMLRHSSPTERCGLRGCSSVVSAARSGSGVRPRTRPELPRAVAPSRERGVSSVRVRGQTRDTSRSDGPPMLAGMEPVNVWDYERPCRRAARAGRVRVLRGRGQRRAHARGQRRRVPPVAAPSARARRRLRALDGDDRARRTSCRCRCSSRPSRSSGSRIPTARWRMGRAAAAAGTVMCLSTMATATWAEIAATGVPRWFQLYVPTDAASLREVIVGRAREAGFTALVLTVDTPVLGRRERDLPHGVLDPAPARARVAQQGRLERPRAPSSRSRRPLRGPTSSASRRCPGCRSS